MQERGSTAAVLQSLGVEHETDTAPVSNLASPDRSLEQASTYASAVSQPDIQHNCIGLAREDGVDPLQLPAIHSSEQQPGVELEPPTSLPIAAAEVESKPQTVVEAAMAAFKAERKQIWKVLCQLALARDSSLHTRWQTVTNTVVSSLHSGTLQHKLATQLDPPAGTWQLQLHDSCT